MERICLITCYMGNLPGYFDYYVATCKKNNTINYIIINDTIAQSYSDENIQFIKWNLEEFNALASNVLEHPIKLVNAWKINEIKPLFGKLFKKELTGFDFWGWCDLDIIWGDVRQFLNASMLTNYDVITSKSKWTAGHFTLFRNNEYCNSLYSRNPKIYELLNSTTYYAFEECCHRWDGNVNSLETLDLNSTYISMYDIVKNAQSANEIKAHFKDIIREHPQPVNYLYKNSRLIDLENNEEFMYYHLITVKKIWRFYIPKYKSSDVLIMTPYGIRSDSDNLILWKIKRAFYCYKGIMKSIKNRSIRETIYKLIKVS